MNKSELIVFRYKQAPDLEFQDTYLAPSVYGLKLGLEFSGNPTNVIQVGSIITIDKTDKTINPWADGEVVVIGIEPSGVYPPNGKTVFTSRDLQLPIVFSSGEDGLISYINENSEYEFYGKLDLAQDNVLPLNFSVADIRDPSKRNTSFSKTITLPGTKDNNKFFKQIYEVGADDSFNANLKVNAVLYTEGQEQLNGVLQLKKIIRTDYKNISYEVNLFGEFSNIFYNLGELNLNELNLGEYNHSYSFANIRNSWDTKIVKNTQDYVNWTTGYTTTFNDTTFVNGYVGLTFTSPHSFNVGDYVFIDKDDKTINNYYDGTCIVIEVVNSTTIVINKPWGSNSNNESGDIFVKNPTGEGYVYPYLTYGNNGGLQNRATQKDFLPAVYVKTIIDKIFEYAGFTYESNFFNSPYFKRLILPFTSDYLVRDTFTLQVQEFRAGLSANTQNFINFNLNQVEAFYLDFPIDFSSSTTPDCFDNLAIAQGNLGLQNYYPSLATGSEPSGRYKSNFIGNQSFQCDFSFKLYYDAIALESLNFDNVQLSQNDLTTPMPMTVRLIIYKKSNGVFTIVGQNEVIVRYPLTPIPISGQTLPTIYNMSVQALDVELAVNDEIFVELETVAGNGQSIVRPEGDVILNVGGNFGIIGMPNCRFYNVGSSNNLQPNENVDLGLSLPSSIKCKDFFINIVKMFNLYVDEKKGETNKLRIEPRDDYYTLGQKIDWSKKLDISKSFDITPLAELTAKDFLYTYKEDKDYWNTDYTTLSQKIYGQYSFTTDNEFLKNPNKNEVIFSPSPQVEYGTSNISVVELKTKSENNGSVVYNRTKSNIRILFYGGVKTYKGWDLNDGNFRLKFGTQNERLYPYAGMEDDPYIYYNSLCFGFPDFWYYQRPAGFNNTIFNKFFRNQITEITDRDSKSVSLSVYLTPSDINLLDFRNLIYINGIYYRLNKVSDYNPLLNQSTKVELLKVNDLTYFQSKLSDTTNGNDNNNDDPQDKNPGDIFTRPVFDNQQLVLGRNNNISSTSDTTVVVGNDNQIYQDSKNILILGGNNNRIGGGLNNIQLIGIDNAIANDNNTIVLGGLISKDGVIVQNVNVLQGGFYDTIFSAITTYQTVFSYTSPLNPINVINGIEDAAAYIGSPLNIDIFNASRDITYQI